MRVMDVLSEATNIIAEGEVLQLMNCNDADVTEARYLQVIRYKTAKLFEAAARLGGLLADAASALEDGGRVLLCGSLYLAGEYYALHPEHLEP